VIFGATGDLTHRKLIPALYNLAADGALPPAISVVGFARRDKTDEVFRTELEEAARKFSRQGINDDLWKNFASNICYHRSEFDKLEGYEALARRLDEMDATRGTGGNRLFYLAAGPDQFEVILENLRKSGLNKSRSGSWSRIIVEKPFGTDLPSAKRLNDLVVVEGRELVHLRGVHHAGLVAHLALGLIKRGAFRRAGLGKGWRGKDRKTENSSSSEFHRSPPDDVAPAFSRPDLNRP
jgi:glucose-6-phosphate 1-dehydrogenase